MSSILNLLYHNLIYVTIRNINIDTEKLRLSTTEALNAVSYK